MSRTKNYESETTQFLRDLLQRNPQIVDEQQKGRALWWDKALDRDEQRRFRESCIPQQPYVYQTKA
ncbi:MAG: DUF3460 family protein [Burkholderiales bacterium]|nr:DUF3460 family protein [Burkholderiales bacterium]